MIAPFVGGPVADWIVGEEEPAKRSVRYTERNVRFLAVTIRHNGGGSSRRSRMRFDLITSVRRAD